MSLGGYLLETHDIKDLMVYVMFDMFGDFLLLLMIVFVCEWFAVKKGYNMFVRSWIITVMVLLFLITFGWYTFGKRLIWL